MTRIFFAGAWVMGEVTLANKHGIQMIDVLHTCELRGFYSIGRRRKLESQREHLSGVRPE